ncbi:magnesium/cobalt transporter CorA [Candidatus Uabimicrobium amorphum]|uniref:Magnesium transport protein CorA n=1 Tax=Uabimicrobium amorphum TaxID=2596890 RepID=A0A5S9IJL8_UABAM|nr:magnesium/cobalt transporter CorA [Candidatus Uabimicrobium amorphum]BBM82582.1 cobalt/magnesium transport protein CorA [Candidatus Uabimicrobium amorphum]
MHRKKRHLKIGLSPGTLVYMGDKSETPVAINVFKAHTKSFTKLQEEELSDSLSHLNQPVWLNVNGLHRIETIQLIGKHFNIHSLVLEDIVNPHQRPKMEEYPHYIYIVLKMLSYEEEKNTIETEQVSIILGKEFVLSFREKSGDVFNSVRNRLKSGKIIDKGMTYLTYTLIDSIVDHYFLLLEEMREDLEELEDDLISNPQPENMHTIHNLKREIISLRKMVSPLREIVRKLQQDSSIVDENVRIYFRDVSDHIAQVIDQIETFREMLSSMLDIYLTSISNKMNEIMKMLTFISTIFIPLSFIVGVYGMNFKHIPELEWQWGYFCVWGIMITIVFSMLFYFKKKRWL